MTNRGHRGQQKIGNQLPNQGHGGQQKIEEQLPNHGGDITMGGHNQRGGEREECEKEKKKGKVVKGLQIV